MSYSTRLPISAFLFYLFLLFLIYLELIPTLPEIFSFLKGLYHSYGLWGLFIASFLEGLAYVGLYFPGSLIIMVAAMFSGGSFYDFIIISVVVMFALFLSSLFNFYFGKYSFFNKFLKPNEIKKHKIKKLSNKGFFLSFLHPNSLGFYFYTLGARNKSLLKILFVPIIMIPYGFLLAYLFFTFRSVLEKQVENPYTMVIMISIWLIIAMSLNYFSNKK